MSHGSGKQDGELLADFRPGYTIWRHRLPHVDVLVVQGEGGDLLAQDVEDGFNVLRGAVAESARFVTFYDLTDGMKNLVPHAPALLRFAAEVRRVAADRQDCLVAVCPNETVRNWVRWLLQFASGSVPAVIVKSTAEGWNSIRDGPTSFDQGEVLDSFGAEAAAPGQAAAAGPSVLGLPVSF